MNQADGTAWMAMYSLNLLRISLELAIENKVYEDTATKFFEHFLYIAEAMTRMGGEDGLWDEQDGFFYDMLALPDERPLPLRVRSIVGLIPLFTVEVIEPDFFKQLPRFHAAVAVVPELPARSCTVGFALDGARLGRAPSAVAAARPQNEDAATADAG